MKTIKTVKAFAAQSNISEKLIRAVIAQIGGWDSFKSSAKDVTNHGADSGFSGFIYHTETVKFFNNNRDEILGLAQDMADEFGQTKIEMIKGFRCLNNDYNEDEIGAALYGPKSDVDTQIANALAWFALEEVCRSYSDALEA